MDNPSPNSSYPIITPPGSIVYGNRPISSKGKNLENITNQVLAGRAYVNENNSQDIEALEQVKANQDTFERLMNRAFGADEICENNENEGGQNLPPPDDYANRSLPSLNLSAETLTPENANRYEPMPNSNYLFYPQPMYHQGPVIPAYAPFQPVYPNGHAQNPLANSNLNEKRRELLKKIIKEKIAETEKEVHKVQYNLEFSLTKSQCLL